jgi:alpha,alpha-trehalase
MRLRPAILVFAFLPSAATVAQQEPITMYIHDSWDTLSRSMTDCASVADSKLGTAPILYLPAEVPMPKAVLTLQQNCQVEVRHLPRRIHREGDLSPDEIPNPGLLYLPNRYVVPGGRFNEMYGWDSYFILLGEIADHRIPLARGTVENFFYEIDHYGSILNANRTYYLTRSQPPFLSSMVLAVYDALHASDPTAARAWLDESEPYLLRDHTFWANAPHLAGTTGLSRYFDLGHGPVPEMADDSTYYVDVIHSLLTHPTAANATFLRQLSPDSLQNLSSRPDSAHVADKAAKPAVPTSTAGYQLTESFFTGDRAMRESGFDTSDRFGPFSGSTQNFAPICLNALLYKYERDLVTIETALHHAAAAKRFTTEATARRAAINKLLWTDTPGLFVDYNTVTHTQSTYNYLTTYYALWSGLATPAQAARLAHNLALFEHPGGLAMSSTVTGEQWDAPFGWAPTNWLAVSGLSRYGYTADADRVARAFTATVEKNYALDGTIREKYNVEDSTANVAVSAGYKANVIGFGWTNGVYVVMTQFLDKP